MIFWIFLLVGFIAALGLLMMDPKKFKRIFNTFFDILKNAKIKHKLSKLAVIEEEKWQKLLQKCAGDSLIADETYPNEAEFIFKLEEMCEILDEIINEIS